MSQSIDLNMLGVDSETGAAFDAFEAASPSDFRLNPRQMAAFSEILKAAWKNSAYRTLRHAARLSREANSGCTENDCCAEGYYIADKLDEIAKGLGVAL